MESVGARPGMADSPRSLRVLLVSPRSGGGGAERAASSLAEGLRTRGHAAWLAVGFAGENRDETVLPIPRPISRPSRLLLRTSEYVRGRGGSVPGARQAELLLRALASPARTLAWLRGREYFGYGGTRAIPNLPPEDPDLVHCHNLHTDFFDLRQLSWLSKRQPLAMTLHDEWTFTGHCAYTMGLDRWRTGCWSCPDLDVYPSIARDATHQNWTTKREIYRRSRLYITAPSAWLLDRAKASILNEGAASFRLIANGVDHRVFRPADKTAAREKLGLPLEPVVLLFTAHRARRNEFKDGETVSEAARLVGQRNAGRPVLMIALGDDGPGWREPGVEMRYVPYEADPVRVALYYQAADVYLHAAKADTFPTVVLEALACGLPVVATAVGGICEQVRSLEAAPGSWEGPSAPRPRATGVLVPPHDPQSMASATLALLSDPELRAHISSNAAGDAATRFDLDRQVTETVDWYREIIEDWKTRPTRASIGEPDHRDQARAAG